MGRGDGKAVIFPKVQAEIIAFMKKIPPGSEVILVPFHQGPQDEARFKFPEDREAAERYVKTLQANGQNTWIYRTLVYTLDRLPTDPKVATVYYIFTDGKDNDKSGPYRMTDVVKRFKLKQGRYDWIYYLALGVDVPKEVSDGLASLPRTKVLQSDVGEVPKISAFLLKPSTLKLGNLKEQPRAQAELLTEVQGQPGPLRLKVDDTSIQSHGAFITVNPQTLGPGPNSLTFELRGTQQLPDGIYTIWLCPSPSPGSVVWPQAIKVEFAYHPPASYRLIPLDVPGNILLKRGEAAVIKYRLEGNRWATDPLRLNVTAPPSLKFTANGKEFPIELSPGQTLEIHVNNQGLQPGKVVQPDWHVELPPGSLLADPFPTLPSVVQPKGILDWLRQLWWLILFLLLMGALWLLTRLRVWGEAEFFPNDGQEPRRLRLRGNQVSLDTITGISGIFVKRTNQGLTLSYPPLVKAKSGDIDLDVEGDVIGSEEEITLFKDGCEVGKLVVKDFGRRQV